MEPLTRDVRREGDRY